MAGRQGQTVAEVAELLGISRDAVRKRIERGSLEATKGDDGTWTVFLDNDTPDQTKQDDSHYWELINDQRQEIAELKEELAKRDAWISNLMESNKELIERIPPQLPAPEQAATRESWWQRLWSRI